MVERQIRELRKIVSETSIPQVVFHDAFLAIAEQFKIACKFIDPACREYREEELREVYAYLEDRISLNAEHTAYFAEFVFYNRKLDDAKRSNSRAVQSRNECQVKVQQSFWRRRKYQRWYEARQKDVDYTASTVTYYLEIVSNMQSNIDSMSEQSRAQYAFLICCSEYSDAVRSVKNCSRFLHDAINECLGTARRLQYNEYSSIDDAEAQKDKAIEELFRFRDRLQSHIQKMEVLEIQGIELKKKIMHEVSTSNPRIDIADAASSDAPLNADGWDGDRANWY